jgi:hypothetical protein
VFEAMILKSPTSKRRDYKKNGVEQHIPSENRDCEYLELQHSPVGDFKPDYVNILSADCPSTSKPETETSVKSEETSHQTKLSTSTINSPYSPNSADPSDDSDLPDYVNVFISSSETPPPPVPPRNK